MQYLLNTSVIWLVSLIAFELFFRRETVHWLNRAYLLGTLLLGLLLPLWQWQHHGAVVLDAMPVALRQAAVSHSVMEQQPSVLTTESMQHINWLWLLYGCGVVVSLGMLLRTIVTCYRLQKGGVHSPYKRYTIIETGKSHGPFSLFHFVFISSTNVYSSEELELLLQHELRHARLFHSIDVLALQLLKAVFWFHPLVHWYDKRLRMVHEYEADAVGKMNIAAYAQFLIEQALLQPAPAFTNTLTHSPVKNRIMMLLRTKTSRLQLAKYLVVLPMTAFFVTACTQNKVPLPEKKVVGNKVYFKGNEFDILTSKLLGKELITIVDDSGTDTRVLDSVPYKMNGEKIYDPVQLTQQPVYKGPDSNVTAFILAQVHSSLAALDDGDYTIGINDVVLDKEGHIAYYQYSGVKESIQIPVTFKEGDTVFSSDRSIKATIATTVNIKEREEALVMLKAYNAVMLKTNKEREAYYAVINQKMLELLNDPRIQFTPGMLAGRTVPTYLDEPFDFYTSNSIRVRNHEVTVLHSGSPARIVRYVP